MHSSSERPWPVTFNDFADQSRRGAERQPRTRGLARTLMDYARANPQTIRGRLMPVIVYDPAAGRQRLRRRHAETREAA